MRKLFGVGVALLLLLAVAGLAAAGGNGNYSVHLNGDTEVPANASKATGQAIFHVSKDGTSLECKLIVAKLDNPVAAHIHLGPPGVNGPVVALLFSGAPGGGTVNGVLAESTITNLVGPLAGQPLSALIDALNSGNAYVNVHTNDGVPPAGTGPGDLPGGEIRGNF
ncbi:MAG TPA: CHRD domain-containing protein [Gaiellaceae bacterium]|nr:CHRD domain-containing protein [Gaiellaceae bacterium]